jgi:hypothetical protein
MQCPENECLLSVYSLITLSQSDNEQNDCFIKLVSQETFLHDHFIKDKDLQND